jgi:hypothetical protein
MALDGSQDVKLDQLWWWGRRNRAVASLARLRMARLAMRAPGWSLLPLSVQRWCIHQWMLQFASYRRFLAEQGSDLPVLPEVPR